MSWVWFLSVFVTAWAHQDCNPAKCPVDCVMNDWSAWGTCEPFCQANLGIWAFHSWNERWEMDCEMYWAFRSQLCFGVEMKSSSNFGPLGVSLKDCTVSVSNCQHGRALNREIELWSVLWLLVVPPAENCASLHSLAPAKTGFKCLRWLN